MTQTHTRNSQSPTQHAPPLSAQHPTAYLQDEGINVIEVRSETLALLRSEVGVAATYAAQVCLQAGQHVPRGVVEVLRVKEPAMKRK